MPWLSAQRATLNTVAYRHPDERLLNSRFICPTPVQSFLHVRLQRLRQNTAQTTFLCFYFRQARHIRRSGAANQRQQEHGQDEDLIPIRCQIRVKVAIDHQTSQTRCGQPHRCEEKNRRSAEKKYRVEAPGPGKPQKYCNPKNGHQKPCEPQAPDPVSQAQDEIRPVVLVFPNLALAMAVGVDRNGAAGGLDGVSGCPGSTAIRW